MDGVSDETVMEVDTGIGLGRNAGGRLRATTKGWQLGRLVRISAEAACGFIRVSSGELIYFAMQDVIAGGGGLRAGARVRFESAGAGIPRAIRVQRL